MKIVKTILVLLSINIGHQQFSINLQSETNWCGPWSFHSNSVFSLSYIGVQNAPTVCERVLRVTCIVAFTFCSQNQTHSRIRNEDKHAFEQMFTFVEFLRMRLINWLEWARAQFHFFFIFHVGCCLGGPCGTRFDSQVHAAHDWNCCVLFRFVHLDRPLIKCAAAFFMLSYNSARLFLPSSHWEFRYHPSGSCFATDNMENVEAAAEAI